MPLMFVTLNMNKKWMLNTHKRVRYYFVTCRFLNLTHNFQFTHANSLGVCPHQIHGSNTVTGTWLYRNSQCSTSKIVYSYVCCFPYSVLLYLEAMSTIVFNTSVCILSSYRAFITMTNAPVTSFRCSGNVVAKLPEQLNE